LTSSIIEAINILSNERQKLWRAKWPRRQKAEYAMRLKELDRQIAGLWKDRRAELSGVIPVHKAIPAFDYTDLGSRDPGYTKLKFDHTAEALPYEDDTLPRTYEILPLSEILRRRNKTLYWGRFNQNKTGVEIPLVSLS
jgi:hypothetical protein